MGERLPLLIVGAGIGGLTAAVALTAKGFGVRLVERSPQLTEIGAGIQLTPNAGRVLASLGLDAAIAAAAVEPEAIDVVNGRSGRRLVSIGGAALRTAYGFPYRVLHRADLQGILAAEAKRMGIRVDLGASVEQLDPAAEAVRASIRTASGSTVVTAPAVVAADGVWSSLRPAIAGAAVPLLTGRTAWRAVIPADAAPGLLPRGRVGLWLGPRAHLVHYPISRGAAINVVAIVEDASGREGWSLAGDSSDLAAKFAGWSALARDMIAAAPAWQKFAIATIDPSRSWLGQRIALLGDAAHALPPFLAQGAAMAIEDAAVLADAFAANQDTGAALRAYVGARQPRVVAIAKASRIAGNRFHMRGMAALARNVTLRVGGARIILRRNRPIYEWRPAATKRGPR